MTKKIKSSLLLEYQSRKNNYFVNTLNWEYLGKIFNKYYVTIKMQWNSFHENNS